MYKLFYICLVLFFYLQSADAGALNDRDVEQNGLDIVFCLDLSGSTNGLITDVRESLWHIVNQVNLLNPKPKFRIGLVGFSRPSYLRENSYVKVLCELTNDFDKLSHELYKIRPAVEAGDQYVGAAINTCVTKINWEADTSTKKIIYIVGNGMVGTNKDEYIKSCQLAQQHNIVVNTMYVMGRTDQARELPGWFRIARYTNGLISKISLEKKSPLFDMRLDYASLVEAMNDLNRTYLYHGSNGYEKYIYMKEADSVAVATNPSVFAERTYYKASKLYKWMNINWEVVDYLKFYGMLPDMHDTLTIPDSLRTMPQDKIYDLAQQCKRKRQRAINRIDYLLERNYPATVHQQYVSGELKEENCFSRNVIIMLIEEWK